jgi:hypothetical protein
VCNEGVHHRWHDRTAVLLGGLISVVGLGLLVGGLKVLFSPARPPVIGFRASALLWLFGLPPGMWGVAELVAMAVGVPLGLVAGGVSVVLRSRWGMRVAVICIALAMVGCLRQAALGVLLALGIPQITWNPLPGSGASRLSPSRLQAIWRMMSVGQVMISLIWLGLLVWVRRRLARTRQEMATCPSHHSPGMRERPTSESS